MKKSGFLVMSRLSRGQPNSTDWTFFAVTMILELYKSRTLEANQAGEVGNGMNPDPTTLSQ
jgi:hypothetical protein